MYPPRVLLVIFVSFHPAPCPVFQSHGDQRHLFEATRTVPKGSRSGTWSGCSPAVEKWMKMVPGYGG